MLKEEDLIGAIVIYYGDPRPLDQDQIALAKNFARQGGDCHRERPPP